ncbi:MAG TPA: hypothetical protein EYP10_12115, partial [Armatimonadetes bacterium]|nr:hypothetical protein [Armatimonadota bacterium]
SLNSYAYSITGYAYLGLLSLLLLGFYMLIIAILICYAYAWWWAMVTVRGESTIRWFVALLVIGYLIMRSLPWRAREPVSIVKSMSEMPRLHSLLGEVAHKVDAPQVHEVRLLPGTEIGIYESGGYLGIPINASRLLLMGMGALHGLNIGELKALLAHEFAHFSRKDALLARIVGGVSLNLMRMLEDVRLHIQWWWLNPFHWLLWIYMLIYMVVARGFNYQREYTADHLAALAYGGNVLKSALETYAIESALFNGIVHEAGRQLAQEGKFFTNMYKAFRELRTKHISADAIRKLKSELLTAKGSALALQPAIIQRIRRIESINPEAPIDERPAVSIFDDLEHVEQELSQLYAAVVHHVYVPLRISK